MSCIYTLARNLSNTGCAAYNIRSKNSVHKRWTFKTFNLSAGFIGKAKFDHTLSLRHFVTLLRGYGDEIFGDELLQNHYMLWFY